jgi:hypothetical protein
MRFYPIIATIKDYSVLLKCVRQIETVIELIKTNYFSIYHFFENSNLCSNLFSPYSQGRSNDFLLEWVRF